MITPDSARNLAYSTLSGLTFIESLIISAANGGYYSVTLSINDSRVNSAVVQELINSGYTVQTITNTLYDRYIIDWLPTPSVTTTPSITPTPSLTPAVTTTPSITPTITPTKTTTPSITPTITISTTVTLTPSRTPTITPTVTITPSITPSITPTVTTTPSITPTITPSLTPTLTPTPSVSATPGLSPSLTATPTVTTTPSITPTITVSNSVTPTVTTTPSMTPTPSILPNVFINNNNGAYSITGVTISGVTVSGVSFPVAPGENKSGFTTKGLTGINITVDLSSNSAGECVDIDGDTHTTNGVKSYTNANGNTNGTVSITYQAGPC